jgi:hypothetical protein
MSQGGVGDQGCEIQIPSPGVEDEQPGLPVRIEAFGRYLAELTGIRFP